MEADLRDVYFMIRADELQKLNPTEEGFLLVENDTRLLLRKVRLCGRIERLIALGNRVDIIIRDRTGEALVRFWDKRPRQLGVDLGDVVDVFGKVRVYMEEIYVRGDIITKIREEECEERRDVIREVRTHIREKTASKP